MTGLEEYFSQMNSLEGMYQMFLNSLTGFTLTASKFSNFIDVLLSYLPSYVRAMFGVSISLTAMLAIYSTLKRLS